MSFFCKQHDRATIDIDEVPATRGRNCENGEDGAVADRQCAVLLLLLTYVISVGLSDAEVCEGGRPQGC